VRVRAEFGGSVDIGLSSDFVEFAVLCDDRLRSQRRQRSDSPSPNSQRRTATSRSESSSSR
jgi:hypothetical protein